METHIPESLLQIFGDIFHPFLHSEKVSHFFLEPSRCLRDAFEMLSTGRRELFLEEEISKGRVLLLPFCFLLSMFLLSSGNTFLCSWQRFSLLLTKLLFSIRYMLPSVRIPVTWLPLPMLLLFSMQVLFPIQFLAVDVPLVVFRKVITFPSLLAGPFLGRVSPERVCVWQS